MAVVVRMLNEEDVAAYRSVRLRALTEHPEAFSSTAEALQQQSDAEVAKRLKPAANGTQALFGAFANEALIGLAGFYRSDNSKLRHHADLIHMYVPPECHGQGVGRQLVEHVITHARQQPGLEALWLSVMVGNEPARRLYLRCAFVPVFIMPRYIKLGDRYYDNEWLRLDL